MTPVININKIYLVANPLLKLISLVFIVLISLVLIREVLMLGHTTFNFLFLMINTLTTALYILVYLLIITIFLKEIWVLIIGLIKKNHTIKKSLFNFSLLLTIAVATFTLNIFGGYMWKLTLVNNEGHEIKYLLDLGSNKYRYLIPEHSSKTYYFNEGEICESDNYKICIEPKCKPFYHTSCRGYLGGAGNWRNMMFSSKNF